MDEVRALNQLLQESADMGKNDSSDNILALKNGSDPIKMEEMTELKQPELKATSMFASLALAKKALQENNP